MITSVYGIQRNVYYVNLFFIKFRLTH